MRHWWRARAPGASRGRRRRRARPSPQTTITTSGGVGPVAASTASTASASAAVVTAIAGRPARAASRAMRTETPASRAAGTMTRRGAPDASAGVGNVRATHRPATPGSPTTRPPTGSTAPRSAVARAGCRGTLASTYPGCATAASLGYSSFGGADVARTRPASAPRSVGATSMTGASANRSRGDSAPSSPVATIASASAKPRSSKSRACRPQVPRWCGLSQLKTPFAPQVFATPRFPASANARSPSTAPASITPGPASTTTRPSTPSISSMSTEPARVTRAWLHAVPAAVASRSANL